MTPIDDPRNIVAAYRNLALAAFGGFFVGGIVAAIALGPDIGGLIIVFGMIVTPIGFVVAVLNDRAHHQYRRNLQAEAEAELTKAQARLGRAKARAIDAGLLPQQNTRLLPEAAPAERPIRYFENGQLVAEDLGASLARKAHQEARDDMLDMREELDSATKIDDESARIEEADAEEADTSAPELAPPRPIGVGQGLVSESFADKQIRIRRLAQTIYTVCASCDPLTQAAIKERIPMTKGGLLRSHQDITDALNELARVGRVTTSEGKGRARRWLHMIKEANAARVGVTPGKGNTRA